MSDALASVIKDLEDNIEKELHLADWYLQSFKEKEKLIIKLRTQLNELIEMRDRTLL